MYISHFLKPYIFTASLLLSAVSVVTTNSSIPYLCVTRGSAAARLLGLRVRIPPGHACLSLVNVLCYQAEVSVLG